MKYKIIKKYGNSSHIILPKKYEGEHINYDKLLDHINKQIESRERKELMRLGKLKNE